MAKPKGTGTSSYTRINEGLASTKEFGEYERWFARQVSSARVDGFTFEKLSVSSRTDGMPGHVFEVACGSTRVPGFSFREPGDLKFNVDAIVTPESLGVVLARFGNGVSTYFCKEDAVKERFVKHVREDFLKRFSGIMQEAENRIADQAQELVRSGRLEDERQLAYENEAVDEIRTVLLKFRNIRRPALKRALDEFIVHDVTES